jgi:tRNA threonylcarbamoyl adenosine modification protein (Sua5/YciO/YrdC/YwlC family)
MSILLKIHPAIPGTRAINLSVKSLSDGGVIICPTDTVYCFACDIYNQRAYERIIRIKGIEPDKVNFSIACYDFSQLSEYTRQIDTPVFRVMKKALPGPFTFILPANSNVPKLFKSKRKTIGIRIPDNNICREIIRHLGHPLITTSVHADDVILDYITNPEMIFEKYKKLVDIVIDGGFGGNRPSTVVDCSEGEFTILRQGLGKIDEYL